MLVLVDIKIRKMSRSKSELRKRLRCDLAPDLGPVPGWST
jgi:hypothetical protein